MKPFVGRVGELCALETTTSSTNAASAIVIGEPGSGKTRLLAEAVARAKDRRVIRVQGYEAAEPVALAAASALLRALNVDVGDRGFAAPLEAMQIFERAYRALRGGPVLLAIDDLQWVDEVSFALCQYLIRGAADAECPVAVLAASRPSPRVAIFARSVEDALPGRLTTVELGPLTRDEGLALARLLNPWLDTESAAALWLRAGGSPFWLEALVRTGGATDAGRFVTLRMRGASGDASELLGALAVAARPLAASDLAELERWPIERADRALVQLGSRGVALRGAATVTLAHDLIREAALAELPAEGRARLHRRLAEWLEARSPEEAELLREALEHRLAAGLPGAELACRLATGARRRLLGRDGLRRLTDVAEREGSRELHADLARLSAELGEHESALELAGFLVDTATDAIDRARWCLVASISAYGLGRVDDARNWLARARERQPDDALLAVELDTHEAALLRWQKSDVEAARALTETAVRDARRLVAARPGDLMARGALLRALQGAFDATTSAAESARALQIAEEMLAATREMGDEDHLRALLHVAMSDRTDEARGTLPDVEAAFRRVWAQANDRVLPMVAVEAGYWLAFTLIGRGKLAEAEVVAAEAVALAGRSSGVLSFQTGTRAQIRSLPHLVALNAGDWQSAARDLEKEAANEGPHHRLRTYYQIASRLARIDPVSEAARVVENVERAVTDGHASGCARCLGVAQLHGAEALARVGRIEEAKGLVRRYDAAQIETTRFAVLARTRAEAEIARAEGHPERALAGHERAEVDAKAMGSDLEALWAKIDRGRTLVVIDRSTAVKVLIQAAEQAERMGAKPAALVADKLLRSLGLRTWRRTASEGALTEREREIARLVAAGASNPEIARRLFVSRKTIERHVSNLLHKVGARNRAELAARVSENEIEGAPR